MGCDIYELESFIKCVQKGGYAFKVSKYKKCLNKLLKKGDEINESGKSNLGLGHAVHGIDFSFSKRRSFCEFFR